MKIIKTSQQIGRTIRNASRLRTIVGVFAKHGFHNIAERIKLGRFILARMSATEELDRYSVAERLRMAFEELGPTFIKLGQLLASRPDLAPPDIVEEFSRLHDNVQALPFETIHQVLKEEFGENLERYFASIDPLPLGAASIAQVHRATLIDGTPVVIKVQRPGIVTTINDDLNVLYFLAELIEQYIEEARPYNPVGIVDEYFKTLDLETNFVVEANNIRRFKQNFLDDPNITIPKVYFDLTTERVLTMEALSGIPLSQSGALLQDGIIASEVIRRGLKAYLKMVFLDGFFHGDLHAGNFFVMPNNQIGLVDFGVVGRLNHKTQTSIANMLFAFSKEDYDRLAYEYIDLAPFSDKVNVDLFAKDLRDLIAPYYGLTLKNVNLGRVLLSSSSIAAKHGLTVPTELMLFFKSVVSVEGLGKRIKSDFDFLTYSLEFASDLMKSYYEPNRMLGDLNQLARESRSLINGLPRQIHFLLRKISSPNYSSKIQLPELKEVKKSIELSFNLLFLGIIIGSLILSASVLALHPSEQMIAGVPTLSFFGYLIAVFLGVISFFNYIRK